MAAPTAQGSGTQAATVTTEHTLLDVAVAGVFQLFVDTVNMVAGDSLELRVYQIILTGGTRHVCMFEDYFDAQPADDLVKYCDPASNELTDAGSLRFTLKQTTGTSRNFPWKVLKFA